MIVVGYVSNTNGMATWCWEAANALEEAGEEVCLVCAAQVLVPLDNKIKIIRLEEGNEIKPIKGIFNKVIAQLKGRLSAPDNPFCLTLHAHLLSLGMAPRFYLFNRSDLVHPAVPVPQYIVAWAYPPSFPGYVSKVGKVSGWKLNKLFLFAVLDSVGWYRRDWKAYRRASGVLAVSERLKAALCAKGVRAFQVYPCIRVDTQGMVIKDVRKKIQVLISALYLEEPRKRVGWLLECLSTLVHQDFEVHLIGTASESFIARYRKSGLNLIFHGRLRREEALAIMEDKDIFLFGSSLDDWGYVQSEAMARGLVALAPDVSPFDEIIGNKQLLYKADSLEALGNKLNNLMTGTDLSGLKIQSIQRAAQLFSRPVFVEKIRNIISSQ
jgi:glycosyltransferase involved in cell wall biosynthesis